MSEIFFKNYFAFLFCPFRLSATLQRQFSDRFSNPGTADWIGVTFEGPLAMESQILPHDLQVQFKK